MFCMHCGQGLPPDARFCPNCGKKLPEGAESGEAVRVAPDKAPGTNTPVEPPREKIDCGLTLAIVAVLLGTWIGFVGLVFSVIATDMLHRGDYEGARRAARTGKYWSWSTIILSAVMIGLGLLILPSVMELVFHLVSYDQSPRPSGGILAHLLELIVPGLKELPD